MRWRRWRRVPKAQRIPDAPGPAGHQRFGRCGAGGTAQRGAAAWQAKGVGL